MNARAVAVVTLCLLSAAALPARAQEDRVEYQLLATKKTSTLEKEMGEAAASGYRLAYMMGGETAFGGDEVVAVMARDAGADESQYEYKLLATNKTSTMQKEMAEAAGQGWTYRAQSVADTTFGGREVIVIMERERGADPAPVAEYLLLATSRTSTMQKELQEAGGSGYRIVGMTVAKTTFGGLETVAILERPAR